MLSSLTCSDDKDTCVWNQDALAPKLIFQEQILVRCPLQAGERKSRSVMSNSLWPHGLYSCNPMEFSRPEYWSGKPFPSPGDLPNPGIKPRSPTLQADSLLTDPPGKPTIEYYLSIKSSHEIKRCLFLGRKAITNLDSIFKSRDITLPTKVHLVKVMAFPVVVRVGP